jgi:hypothetical protein
MLIHLVRRTSGFALAAAATAALGLAAPAVADDIEPSPGQDESFARFLDSDGVLFNFKLQRYQGLRLCEDITAGQDGLDAIYALMRKGDYSFDVANAISASAKTAYCPWNLGR